MPEPVTVVFVFALVTTWSTANDVESLKFVLPP